MPTDITLQPGESITIHAAEPAPPPPPARPSGINPPAAKAGWTRFGFSDFDTPVALGSWTGAGTPLMPRPDVARDGTFLDSSGRAKYDAKKTISQEGGLLIARGKQIGTQRYAGCPILATGTEPDGLRVSFALKCDAPQDGWKIAFLSAVQGANVAERGEHDFPECKLGDDPQVNAFAHKVGGAQVSFRLDQTPLGTGAIYDWHMYTTEWKKGQYVDFFIDGKLLTSASGTTSLITNPPPTLHSVTGSICAEPMHWVGQLETFLAGQAIPATMGEVQMQYDWIAFERPS